MIVTLEDLDHGLKKKHNQKYTYFFHLIIWVACAVFFWVYLLLPVVMLFFSSKQPLLICI